MDVTTPLVGYWPVYHKFQKSGFFTTQQNSIRRQTGQTKIDQIKQAIDAAEQDIRSLYIAMINSKGVL
ncbi:hypothetical protein CO704_21875 [Cedecea neteri]|uniref:Uncharacterized protein n=1 Tax=Cedecea neteri TaxID=158822 RepID=A0A291E3A9_9ENTR|nr:hypothetical protein CO704_21875 [Cedecea neteri]